MVIGVLYARKYLWPKDLLKWGNPNTARRLTERLREKSSLTWLAVSAILLLNIAAVNPQWGLKTRAVEKKTADIYILLDISNSMLAEDIAPNRLERAKRFALELASAFKSDRIGLVVFAGNAYMQSPLTTDWHAIHLYLNAAHPDQAGTQGTEIGKAIRLAAHSRSEEETSGEGAMIIITDGEDHDSDAPTAINDAVSGGWTTYIIGVGTEQGGTIPMMTDKIKDVKRDESGQPVVTKLNRTLMMQLAQQGNGHYFDITDGQSILESLKTELAKLERSHMEKRSFSEHKSYYQWFLMAAIIAILLIPTIRYKYDVI
ncbi:MAG TPA: VWA domain-containing protein [Saprospiraceae bacterium]|nr:VWA domain-containing protein [Saprospiraceae bacterium]